MAFTMMISCDIPHLDFGGMDHCLRLATISWRLHTNLLGVEHRIIGETQNLWFITFSFAKIQALSSEHVGFLWLKFDESKLNQLFSSFFFCGIKS